MGTSSYTLLGDIMKKFFECIGMISLVCVSFFFTEKTARVVKETDEIMVEIKKTAETHINKSIDAIIKDDTIIPGIYGGVVDIGKSYEKMKRVGSYQENLLIYKKITPSVSIEKNFDKYIISGNPKKNMVTLLFLIKDNEDTTKIEKILKQKGVKASFFVDGNWFESHNDKIYEWINNDYTVGNLSYNMDYTNSSFIWMDTIIKRVGNQQVSFCYNENPNKEALKICAINKNYTVRPTTIISNSPLSEVKMNLTSGSIIALPINQTVEKELPVIIEYIKGKGYKIENLYNHLNEAS